jgi:hypothetical protein
VGVLATLSEWLLFLHIVAAMVWVGGPVALNVLVAIVLRSGGADDVTWFVSVRRLGHGLQALALRRLVG